MTALEKETLEYCNQFRRKARKSLARGTIDCCVDNVISNTIGNPVMPLVFQWSIYFPKKDEEIRLPENILEFMTRFNEGKYPHLQHEVSYYDN